MRVKHSFAASMGAAVIALAACSAPQPKVALSGGYYVFENRGAGTGKRAHFDLVASDDVPSSGRFFITQNGTNCGTLGIEPLQSSGVQLRVLVVRYGIGIERFYPLPDGDARRYSEYDDANTRGILE